MRASSVHSSKRGRRLLPPRPPCLPSQHPPSEGCSLKPLVQAHRRATRRRRRSVPGSTILTESQSNTAGNVFIADTRNNRVVEVPASGGPQFTVGSGFQYPQGVALDSRGNLYVADSNNNQVVELNLRTGQQTTIASGLNNPTSVAVDPAGNVYIANTNSGQVLELTGTGSKVVVASSLVAPFGVGVDGRGNLFIADSGTNQVLERPVGGGSMMSLGTGLNFPTGVAVDPIGDVFIADYGANQVIEIARRWWTPDVDRNGIPGTARCGSQHPGHRVRRRPEQQPRRGTGRTDEHLRLACQSVHGLDLLRCPGVVGRLSADRRPDRDLLGRKPSDRESAD